MTWFKNDDSFYDHPKVVDAPDCAVALWTRAGCWSARYLTDGFVPTTMPARLCDDPDTAVKELVARGLWERAKGGYRFHDWGDYQPTRESVESDRAAARERMRVLRNGRSKSHGSEGVRANNSEQQQNSDRTSRPPTRPDQEPSKEGSDADRLRFDNAVRIPEPFPLSEEMKQWVRDNTPSIDGWKEHQKLIDHFLAAPDKTGRKKDWLATWRNWMRRAQEYAEENAKRRGEDLTRHVEVGDERCARHPRQLAGFCQTCDSERKGSA